MESNLESCLIVRREGKIVAIGHNDLDKRAVVFYKTTNQEMSLEDFAELFKQELLNPNRKE